MVYLATLLWSTLLLQLGLVRSALASLAITSPSASSSWRINTANKVTFTSSSAQDPSDFTVAILDADQKILSGAYALASSAQLDLADSMIRCPGLPVGFGYILVFANVSDNTQVYAASEQFAIQAATTNSSSSVSAAFPTSSFLAFPGQLVALSSLSLDPASTSTTARPTASSSQISGASPSRSSDMLCPSIVATLLLSAFALLV